ncbi:MAG: hypothetical protein H6932_00180 [Burkholderiaceae bacterium]|nr:hypothetical protein [Burkholderiaceae bacterium]
MPYYLFSIRSFGRIEKRGEHSGFREASAAAKLMRQGPLADGEQIKVMFAENEDQAIELLCQPRQAGPAGDD